MEKKKVVALDFDGLICDGLKECILVAWNGYHGKDTAAFSDDGLAAIPQWFAERFGYLRNFAKHLGHFYVPLVDSDTSIISQADFDARYKRIPGDDVYQFVTKVSHYRQLVREEMEERWLGYHTLYPGMKDFLASIKTPAYIVTAKDRQSVLSILKRAGIEMAEERVYGDRQAKLEAFADIARKEQIANESLYFFDDNVLNVIEAKNENYNAYWATWGYNIPNHYVLAKQNSVRGISLPTFLQTEFEMLSQ
ncbi:MAG: hypothetical protein A2Z44_06435 [Betaproteobacteria bacterium RBG_19FT_COMBO_58_11]|nr:MAG: hypothetical protein A2Z44_06435 [Betaproteobacteria bacterium RBG_19FT_COMBO_58_11]